MGWSKELGSFLKPQWLFFFTLILLFRFGGIGCDSGGSGADGLGAGLEGGSQTTDVVGTYSSFLAAPASALKFQTTTQPQPTEHIADCTVKVTAIVQADATQGSSGIGDFFDDLFGGGKTNELVVAEEAFTDTVLSLDGVIVNEEKTMRTVTYNFPPGTTALRFELACNERGADALLGFLGPIFFSFSGKVEINPSLVGGQIALVLSNLFVNAQGLAEDPAATAAFCEVLGTLQAGLEGFLATCPPLADPENPIPGDRCSDGETDQDIGDECDNLHPLTACSFPFVFACKFNASLGDGGACACEFDICQLQIFFQEDGGSEPAPAPAPAPASGTPPGTAPTIKFGTSEGTTGGICDEGGTTCSGGPHCEIQPPPAPPTCPTGFTCNSKTLCCVANTCPVGQQPCAGGTGCKPGSVCNKDTNCCEPEGGGTCTIGPCDPVRGCGGGNVCNPTNNCCEPPEGQCVSESQCQTDSDCDAITGAGSTCLNNLENNFCRCGPNLSGCSTEQSQCTTHDFCNTLFICSPGDSDPTACSCEAVLICGDSICHSRSGESFETCPADCPPPVT